MDANWRWLHNVGGYQNCYTGNKWNTQYCPDDAACAKNCALDGVPTADWRNTYGVTSTGSALKLDFVTQGQYAKNVGSRTYMMNGDSTYQMFKLKNREFTFDVDVSQLPCGLNGALYFVQMDEDGGLSKFSGNKAGAKYGTGYCDAQCPHDIKFINGEGNADGWKPSASDPNAGVGKYGSCCAEMDIWEANSISSAFTAHPCQVDGQTRCQGTQCGDDASGERAKGVCDKDGCDLNAYRAGVHDFFGPGKTVDTTKKLTVVTQFITSDNTDNGDVVEIRRKFVQDGKVIEHPKSNIPGLSSQYDSLKDDMCENVKQKFGDANTFKAKGGMKKMSDSLGKGMVLVMSLWDDHAADMLWLDSTYPTS